MSGFGLAHLWPKVLQRHVQPKAADGLKHPIFYLMAININKHGNYFQTNLNKVGIAVSSQGGTRETSKIQLFRALHQSQIGKYEA